MARATARAGDGFGAGMTGEPYAWWSSLRHGGLLIAPARLRALPADPPPLAPWRADRLRRDLVRAGDGDAAARAALIRTVLEVVCGLDASEGWRRGPDLGTGWTHRDLTGVAARPWGVWQPDGPAPLPVFVDDAARLGMGRGRRGFARVVEWLRRARLHLALVTNGRQWRLVYAGLDHHAWAEWDADGWLEHGQPGLQVAALRALLAPEVLAPGPGGGPGVLLGAVLDSRRGQVELTQALGERVRRAVELLIQACGPRLEALGDGVPAEAVYVAACRAVMRLVVVLFAEARDLLPRDNALYHGSYGLAGLREQLAAAGGVDRLGHRRGAWPRILALWRLVHAGSHHPELPVPRYGGGLFEPGDAGAADGVRRALAVFEHPDGPHDGAVWGMLDLISRCPARVAQGRGSAVVLVPVDFADLSTEYIGILYEGLLDFELRRAAAGDPMVFLAMGDEPALPLSRLEALPDAALREMLKKLRAKAAAGTVGEGADGADEDDGDGEGGEEDGDGAGAELGDGVGGDAGAGAEGPDGPSGGGAAAVAGADGDGGLADGVVDGADAWHAARRRALAWGRRAAALGMRRPRGASKAALAAHERALDAAAEGLIVRLVLPGEWFLVRWGGTRKGAGTFYTPPGLAVPTVQRTLRPLAYVAPAGEGGRPDELAPPDGWRVRAPEEILALRVCDPAMGSGSFLVAALRFLTDAMFESLNAHDRLAPLGDGRERSMPFGLPVSGGLDEERMPSLDGPDGESVLRARLKRHVVERCIYGVDIDPLAVELARLALWVETMDRSLPFGFVDHKLKVGNALVGCWFDRFRDYPALAWEREGGDKGHKGVHFGDGVWTRAIKGFRNGRVKAELPVWIAGQRHFLDAIDGRAPEAVREDLRSGLEALHRLVRVDDPEAQAEGYGRLVGGEGYLALKAAFDTWCACWFWPADDLDAAPSPATFERPGAATAAGVAALARRHGFFHWELEFPEVFGAAGSGFDAVVGNPPWEIQKPNSKEFFSNLDPLYRSYGKQEALRRQREIFAGAEDERAWLVYNARFKALSSWSQNAGRPFGDGEGDGGRFNLGAGSDGLHGIWRRRRAGWLSFADVEHPFRHQGSADINTYKMFVELGRVLLREDGRLGLVVPSGLYTDKGATALRELLLDRSRWRWLFGFENRLGIFDIDGRFKFCPIIVEKGGATDTVAAAFMRHALADWESAEQHVLSYGRAQVERFSPRTRAILEIRGPRDIAVLEKMYAGAVLLGDDGPDGWGIRYAREFDMTNDSHLFPPRPQWEAKGYRPDAYGRWVGPEGDLALPLYQGVMIYNLSPNAGAHVGGAGHHARWIPVELPTEDVRPQFLMAASTFRSSRQINRGLKIVYRSLSNATNERTMVVCVVDDLPCGNSLGILTSEIHDYLELLYGSAVLASLPYDWTLRQRIAGTNINSFFLWETGWPRVTRHPMRCIGVSVARLVAPGERHARQWWRLQELLPGLRASHLARLWAITPHERLRLRAMLDAIVAELYGLDWDDLAYILRDCDHPGDQMRQNAFTRALDPKGFWRVDKEQDPELRHTVLSLVAFHELKAAIAHAGSRDQGIEDFAQQHDGDGWMLPESLRLADYGLGHDERAQAAQPVRQRMGERFLPWQLEQTPEESWVECERHARNILGETEFRRLQRELAGEAEPERKVAEAPAEYETKGQKGLWDD